MRPLAILALVALSWAVAFGLFWLALFVSPWLPLGLVAAVLLIAIPPDPPWARR